MIKLTAKGDWQKSKWYFKTREEAEKFKYTFIDHTAYIIWEEEEKDSFPEMTIDDIRRMEEDPKKRAENNLCWAFNSYMKDNKELKKKQEETLNTIVNTIMKSIDN